MSELKIINENSENLIVSFGGMSLEMGGIPPFEFLNYLSKTYKDVDLIFYIDKNQAWYHKGIDGISTNIDETVDYLNNIINRKNYKKVIFMGTSAGGYASILFGSLCKISNVIAYIPRTKLIKPFINNEFVCEKYINLKSVINDKTKYLLCGNISENRKYHNHHISQCNNLLNFKNVKLNKYKNLIMKELRDNGTIKKHIDEILF